MIEGPNESGSFRRQIPPEDQVTLRFEKFSSFVEEYRAGVSLGGVFIKTHRPRPVGTEIHFEFKLTDGFRLLHGQGTVVWIRPKDLGPDQPAGMGARFTAIDESGRQLVLKLLEEQVKAGGAPFEVDKVPEGATALPDVGSEPALDSEEPTLLGTSVQDLDPSLPSPETARPQQAELGFDAPWGKKLPGVPEDLLGEESDPEVEKAVDTIRPTVGLEAAGLEAAPPDPTDDAIPISAPEPQAAIPMAAPEPQTAIPMPAPAAPEPEAASAPSVPPVSSNLASTPVAPPIQEGPDEPPSPALPEPAFDLEDLPEEPTLIGTAPPAVQAELPLAVDPPPLVELDPAPAPSFSPEVSEPPPRSAEEASLEDSMVEAADEIEASMQLQDREVGFDPAPEDISFDMDEAPTFEAEGADAPSFELPEPGGEPPSFDPSPGSEEAGVDFGAVEPTAEMPLAEAPDAAVELPEPTAEMPYADLETPSFETDAPAPSFEADPAAELPEPTAEMPYADLETPSFEADAPAPSFETDAPPSFETEPPAPAFDLEPSSASFGGEAAALPFEEQAPGAPSFESGSSDAFFDADPPPAAPLEAAAAPPASFDSFEDASDAGPTGNLPASTDPQDFVDKWSGEPTAAEEGSWEEEDFSPPPRKGAGKHLVAVAVLVALVAGAYVFRGPLGSLLGLEGDSAPTAQVAESLGPPPEPAASRAEPADEVGLSDDEAVVGDSDVPRIEVQPTAEDLAAEPPAEDTAEAGGSDGERSLEGAGVAGSRAEEPVTIEEPTPAPAAPPSPRTAPAAAGSSPRSVSADASSGGGLTSVDWSATADGTLVVLQFAGVLSEDRFSHDPLAWAADREMLTLFGVDNYPTNEIAVGTPQLQRIRLGFHPGRELRLVFDLGSAGSSLADLRVSGSRLEILVR